MKFRAITGWALLAKQREYWPPILVQGALIPQSFSLLNPFCFSPEGGRKESGYACEVPLLAGTYMVPKNVYFPPAVYQVPYLALDVLAFS